MVDTSQSYLKFLFKGKKISRRLYDVYCLYEHLWHQFQKSTHIYIKSKSCLHMIRGRSCKNFEDPRVERVWKSLQKQLGQKTASILLDLVLNKIYDLDIIKASLKKLYDAFLVLETKEESLL